MKTTKQAIHQKIGRQLHRLEEHGYLLKLVYEIRDDHPTLHPRAMYFMLQNIGMGRDAFEQFCKENSLNLAKKRSFHRTTNSTGVVRFDNLYASTELSGINQAWSSDITYFEVKGLFYYITFVMDCYSRRILGHQVSKRLTTEETTLPALKRAVSTRRNIPGNLIFHSDGGGQYYDKEFLKYTARHKMRNSMCELAYENGKAERLNGVIKNNYLVHNHIQSFSELVKSVDRAVTLYNTQKPHKALKYKSPVDYEKNIV